MRDNFVRYGREIKTADMEHMFSRSRLIRTEIMTLLGLMVRQPVDYAHPGIAEIDRLISESDRLLAKLHENLSSAMFADMFDVSDGTLIVNPEKSGNALREPIFYGGESAYGFQYREFARCKYARDDDWLLANKGFRIADACDVVAAVARLQDQKALATFKSLRTSAPEQWTMLPGFTITPDELAALCALDPSVVDRVLAAFCLPPGNLNASFTTLNDYNAVNGTPLLCPAPQQYVLFHQYSLFEALYDAPFYWMGADKKYAPTAFKHRGHFTEQLAFERLKVIFGEHAHVNVDVWKRKGGDKLGEIDCLVLFGDRAVVLQAKSKKLTLEARKGNDQRIKQDFGKAVQEAYDQALLCASEIAAGSPLLTDADGNPIAIEHSPRIIYPVCLVSDHYPALAAQAQELLREHPTNVISAALVIDVFALDAMTEMLAAPLHMLSYIDLRARFSSKITAMHEHMMLSYHLKRNLWVDDEYDSMSLEDNIAADLDIAMAVRREGLPGRRTPVGILTRLVNTPVGKIVAEIEARADPSTIGLGLLLVQMNERSADDLNRGIRLALNAAARDGRNHDITLGFGTASSGITIHCNPAPDPEAAEALRRHCEARKYSSKARTWFGLVLRPDTGTTRFGLQLDFPWSSDPHMDAVVRHLPQGKKDIRLRPLARHKPGRNDPCPCGSGRKYKRCCMA
ncbi:SEC-C metal-binding domain-containing protein [Hyphomicrobium sp. CS1BSMeth3]|uniref:SEC-C metal-binding domain-containing protein n=1 Tax=Hyphomicrobium sp. CS1BSMeth3 TaxID=1892844 RepID=UPI0015759DD3|nr:SEC-C metal-binding domain-containing protein [Hyphomicrobium sp. CS1BSMeth3]